MIHNTGHTASEVVVKRGGVTYIRGRMFHDPQLETPGRTPDHVARDLGEKWHVAIRNTVPRQRNRREHAVVAPRRQGVVGRIQQAA